MVFYDHLSYLPFGVDHPCINVVFFVSTWFVAMLWARFNITPDVLEEAINEYLEQQNAIKIEKEIISNYNYDTLLDNYHMQQMLLESSESIINMHFEDLV
jgi:hypothetical protein